jgi:DNA polymerase-3 subunit epsilon
MKELALSERFEEAAEVRNRLLSLIKGISRSQRIVSLKRIGFLIAAIPLESAYEVALIQSGRLIASRKTSIESLFEITSELKGIAGRRFEEELPSHEEIETILRFLNQPEVKLLEVSGEWASPLFGGEQNRNRLIEFKNSAAQDDYKEVLTISWEKLRQR